MMADAMSAAMRRVWTETRGLGRIQLPLGMRRYSISKAERSIHPATPERSV
jgi:hypothetical protein